MPVTCLYFYFILIVVVVIYYMFPDKMRWGILLFSSLALYVVFAGEKALLLMLCSAVITYVGANGITCFRMRNNCRLMRLCFWGTLGVVIGILSWYNYLNFVLKNLNYVSVKIGVYNNIPLIEALPPLGASFYSLSLLSYLIDVYWGIEECEKNIGKIILHACYFPAVTMGPILKYNKFREEIKKEKSIHYESICFAIQRILWGIYKKAVIADYFSVIIYNIFCDYADYAGSIVLGASLLSTIQLYIDFSAGIDIVLGISQLFGIKLPENFDRPFESCSITELFRRWHISLGNWLKDYIYFPLMKSSFIQRQKSWAEKRYGKRVGKKVSTFSAMLIMWTINGLWHGAAWKYIIGVGVLLWFIMLLEDLCKPYRVNLMKACKINEGSRLYIAGQRTITYIKFSIMMIFFNAEGVIQGIKILRHILLNLFAKPDISFLFGLGISKMEIFIIIFQFILYLSITHMGAKVNVQKWIAEKAIWKRWGIYYWVILSILLFSANSSNVREGFIYAQF